MKLMKFIKDRRTGEVYGAFFSGLSRETVTALSSPILVIVEPADYFGDFAIFPGEGNARAGTSAPMRGA